MQINLHPLAVISEINGEETIDSWGFASLLTAALRQQGLDGIAAKIIRAEVKVDGINAERLMENTIGGSKSSERELQVHIREALEDKLHDAHGISR